MSAIFNTLALAAMICAPLALCAAAFAWFGRRPDSLVGVQHNLYALDAALRIAAASLLLSALFYIAGK